MPTDNIPYPQDPSAIGRRGATRSRTEDAVTKHWDRVIVEDERIRTFKGVGATFRIPGSAATPQNLWSIYNTTGSSIIVALKELWVTSAQTVANLTHPPWYTLTRITTAPTGGTAFTKTPVDTRDAASAANVEVRGGASVDGTAATITATAAGQRLASAHGNQLYTAVGVLQAMRIDILAAVANDFPLLLQANQGFLLQVNTAAAADNLATRSHIVDCAWTEFTEF